MYIAFFLNPQNTLILISLIARNPYYRLYNEIYDFQSNKMKIEWNLNFALSTGFIDGCVREILLWVICITRNTKSLEFYNQAIIPSLYSGLLYQLFIRSTGGKKAGSLIRQCETLEPYSVQHAIAIRWLLILTVERSFVVTAVG